MTALLDVRDLGKHFGGLHAVAELSFTVGEGEILGLIGPNGAGKSTVFNLVNGVYPPDQGRVIFRGEDITGVAPFHVVRHGLARTHQIVHHERARELRGRRLFRAREPPALAR
jgi:branched-chain amino acid transport system ATP-binding protein